MHAIILGLSGPVLPSKLGLPESFSLHAWKQVVFVSPIWSYLINSFIVASYASIITLLVSVPAAYSFSRSQSRIFGLLFFGFLIFRMIPWITPLLPSFILMNNLHLVDTKIGIAIMHSLWNIPICIWLMRSFFDQVSPEMEEAALVDGASLPQILIRISLPLAAGGLAVSIVYIFLRSYIEFMYALTLSRTAAMTFPVKLNAYATGTRMFWREMTVAALASTGPMIVLFTFFQRHIVRGLTFGALKG